jgi:dihydrofolate synthase/folylpolyglutamate synthase
MDYSQALEFLYSQLPMFQRIGAAAYKADLGNTIELTRILGHPEKELRAVHIAGTNGKGSVSHMLASVLQEAGYKTGLYTSPHLKEFRERIRVNGKVVPKRYVTQFVAKYKSIFDRIQPSFFEYTAVMAFDYFAREKVDIAILETGMGGRLDSTNIITPILSVITNISLDHTAFLGNTLPEIAAEKAGIIKPAIPVIIGETQQQVSDIFTAKATELHAPISFADKKYSVVNISPVTSSSDKLSWNIQLEGKIPYITLKCPLKGNYQEKNLVTVLGAIEALRKQGYKIPDESIQLGMEKVVENTGFFGRWHLLGENPRIICDVGHNEAGIGYILKQLKQEKYRHLHWVIGIVNDKEAATILRLLPSSAKYYFCKADIPRGKDAEDLKKVAGEFGLEGDAYPTVKEAFRKARINAQEDDLIFIGGSTFVVAEVLFSTPR